MRETRKALAGALQQQLDPVLVGNFGAVDLGLEHESLSIHEQVSLSAADLLTAVVASCFAAYPACLGRLRIDYARAGLWVSAQSRPRSAALSRSKVPSMRHFLNQW